MKLIKNEKATRIVVSLPIAIVLVWMLTYNMMHPEMTPMQIFILMWRWYVVAMLFPAVAVALSWIFADKSGHG